MPRTTRTQPWTVAEISDRLIRNAAFRTRAVERLTELANQELLTQATADAVAAVPASTRTAVEIELQNRLTLAQEELYNERRRSSSTEIRLNGAINARDIYMREQERLARTVDDLRADLDRTSLRLAAARAELHAERQVRRAPAATHCRRCRAEICPECQDESVVTRVSDGGEFEDVPCSRCGEQRQEEAPRATEVAADVV